MESRKYVSKQLDTFPYGIYGSAHHMHRFDIIARRSEFLSNPHKFNYEIKDTLRFLGKNVFKVFFKVKP